MKATPFQSIDTKDFSQTLRRRGIDLENRKVLVTSFGQSDQAKDFTLPANCAGFGRVHHFKRHQPAPWPENPLPIDPAAKALGREPLDILRAQVFQNAICSWRCWYCFVDFDLLSANPKFSEFKTADELLDLYLAETDRCFVIDLSGGQPDLVPEWGLWFAQALSRRNLNDSIYLWTDDNLSNEYIWQFLQTKEVEQLAGFQNYGRVGCFKGFDAESFSFNTKADPKCFERQFEIMKRLIRAGFDVYGYVTLTTPNDQDVRRKISEFVDGLQERVHPNFPLRTIPLRISRFTPTNERLGPEQKRSLELQETVILAWNEELESRFPLQIRQKRITEHSINNR
jgi:uncharacterized Fe-S cluster-containing radical SAM superfamily protein